MIEGICFHVVLFQIFNGITPIGSPQRATSSFQVLHYKRNGFCMVFSRHHAHCIKETSALPWDQFFDFQKTVDLDGSVFNVFMNGSLLSKVPRISLYHTSSGQIHRGLGTSGPVFLCLHGGGYSGTTWACLAVSVLFFYVIDCGS